MDDRKDASFPFPSTEAKLQARNKKSLFEKQRAEAEEKRRREEAETAAAYQDFVKSFDDADDAPQQGGYGGYGSSGYGGSRGGGGHGDVTGPPRRHYGGSNVLSAPSGPSSRFNQGAFAPSPRSGPGSLGPPPPSLAKKRAYDERPFDRYRDDDRRDRHSRRDHKGGVFGFDDEEDDRDRGRPAKAAKHAFNTSDDEDERRTASEPIVPKPTVRLANMPPGTSTSFVKSLIPTTLTVDEVRLLASTGGTPTERRNMSAIVTLAKDTPANEIDTAVSALQNRYLGYGFYLNLHRHLSSAALSSNALPATAGGTAGAGTMPFGAKAVEVASKGPSAHIMPGGYRGIAPPTSYSSGPSHMASHGPILHVPVGPPRDIKQLQLIHRTVEMLLTHGPEFEALLMSRPEVQREEKWAWLWDARSEGGVYYRWRIWEVLSGYGVKKGNKPKYVPLFEDAAAWKAPEKGLAFEYTTRLEDLVESEDYVSEDDESDDEGPAKPDTEGPMYLNPLEKAKLTHLLARLPTSTGRLRKGDVARVTAFAIQHAGRGADEVVEAILNNIERPYAFTSANPDRQKHRESSVSGADHASSDEKEREDTTSASLIGLYLLSDILSSCSTAGVRHAWRYRQLFEAALRKRRTFELLGRFEKRLRWGKLRGDKWKRSVGNVLRIWEGWSVFPQDAQEHFVESFNNPPLSKEEEEEEKRKAEQEKERKAQGRWKAVEARRPVAEAVVAEPEAEEDVDGEPMEEDVDGEPMVDDDEDVDGVPMEEEDDDVDGEPMVEDEEPAEATAPPLEAEIPGSPARPVRKRPKAVDMFADSGSEDET
jgi:U2-associated protein SR140